MTDEKALMLAQQLRRTCSCLWRPEDRTAVIEYLRAREAPPEGFPFRLGVRGTTYQLEARP